MHHIFWVVLCAAGILLLFLSLIAYLILSDGKSSTSKTPAQNSKKYNFSTDLDKMILAASDAKLDDKALKELVKLYTQTHKLGTKSGKDMDEASKQKLEFVSALASNVNASPQTISFLNKELKKLSSSFKKEIDAYEQMGLAKRKIKEES